MIITKFDEFTLLNVYFPNGKKDAGRLNYKMKFYEYFLNYIIELKDILEVIYVNPINTIKATFINGSVLLFNNNLTVNCMDIANENPNLFTTLSELFQNIKMSIIFKIN